MGATAGVALIMRWDLGGRLCSLHSPSSYFIVEKREKGVKDKKIHLLNWWMDEMKLQWSEHSRGQRFQTLDWSLPFVAARESDGSWRICATKSQIVPVFSFLPKCQGPHCLSSVKSKVSLSCLDKTQLVLKFSNERGLVASGYIVRLRKKLQPEGNQNWSVVISVWLMVKILFADLL